VSGSGIRWAICKSAPRSREITTPATHPSVFYRPDALPVTQPTKSSQLFTNAFPRQNCTYSLVGVVLKRFYVFSRRSTFVPFFVVKDDINSISTWIFETRSQRSTSIKREASELMRSGETYVHAKSLGAESGNALLLTVWPSSKT